MENSISKPNRVSYLDYSKAIGIFLVIWGHSGGTLRSDTSNFIVRIIFQFHMPLFFIISGIGISMSLKNNRADLKKKAVRLSERLLLPYVFWSAVYIPLNILAAVIKHRSITEVFLERGYAFLTGRIAPIWFLYSLFMAEMTFFAINNIIIKFSRSKQKILWSGSIILLTVISIVLDQCFKIFNIDSFGIVFSYPAVMIFRFFPALLFLIIGYLLNCIFEHTSLFKRKSIILTADIISVTFFAIFIAVTKNPHVNMHLFSFEQGIFKFIVSGISGSLSVILFSMLLPENIPWLSKIGRQSMHLMAIHYPPIPIDRVLSFIAIAIFPDTIFLAVSAVELVVCYIITVYIFEPVCNWLRSVVNRMLSTPPD